MPSLRDLLDPHGLAIRAATGMTPAELYDAAANGQSAVPYDPARPDRAVHGLAAERMAQRFGPDLASLLGLGKEVVQGVGSLATGGDFYGPTGMDQEDLVANETGIQRAVDNEALQQVVRPGYGLETAEIKPQQPGMTLASLLALAGMR